ncbi:MAG: M48 family metallopeptidase, partial [Betaproteobacteria bacterium]
MNSFSYIFIASVVLMAITRIWLARRQINNVDRNKNTVPTAFANDIPLAEHQKAAAYTVAKTKFSIIVVLYEAAILFGLTLGGVINLTYESISAMELTPILEGLVFLGVLSLVLTLIEIPLGLYKTFVLEEKFGFNKMTLGLFVRDTVLGLVIGAIFGAILIGIILWLMQTSGPNWWILAWGAAIVFWLFIQFISPTLIAPLFNKFSPLEDEQLKIRIENLLRKCGFASKGLFVMDGSKRSSHGNAYFTGFGKNKRIVFFDTLIEKHQPEEVEAVLA